MSDTLDLPQLATPKQVADYIQTTPAALAQDRYHGRGIPFIKVGNRVRYLRDDIAAYLAAQRVTCTRGAA